MKNSCSLDRIIILAADRIIRKKCDVSKQISQFKSDVQSGILWKGAITRSVKAYPNLPV